ncbi:PAAR domain-containing protein [Pseudomonas sp. Hp2]|uniref:PAAR domain-containing protein n=1 Tax=Pseudomonas sp. Hp2 TaxID=701189 RepID=UPI001C49B268|nr:PAAR domain-containing protein [Pseudomonas sp. Hp2]
MSRPFILVGDRLDHGGSVVSGSGATDVAGKQVARVGDRVVCSKHGQTSIVSGDGSLLIDGSPVARHGDKTACGGTLISSQMVATVDSGGGGGGSGGGAGKGGSSTAAAAAAVASVATAGAAIQQGQYDEGFILKSKLTGKPLANRQYRILREDGGVEEGVTDDGGRTHLVATELPQVLRVELLEEQAT